MFLVELIQVSAFSFLKATKKLKIHPFLIGTNALI